MMRDNCIILLSIASILISNTGFASNTGNSSGENGQNNLVSTPVSNEIRWYKNDFPPYFITDGQLKNKGILDLLYPHVIDIFPGFKHKFFISNNLGFLKRADSGDDVCSLSVMKTEERAEKVFFSKPYLYVLQNAVFVRGQDIDKFVKYLDKEGRVSLKELIEDENLRIGIMQGASYGLGIDGIISKSINNKNVITRKGSDFSEGLFKMLKLGRIDYMITYDESIQFLLKKLNFKSEYLFIPIADDSVKHLNQGRVACAKTKVGKLVIEKVNNAIEEGNLVSKAQEYYMGWLSEGAIKEYKKTLRERDERAKQEKK